MPDQHRILIATDHENGRVRISFDFGDACFVIAPAGGQAVDLARSIRAAARALELGEQPDSRNLR